MYIIIAGGGRVGLNVYELLLKRGEKVTLIDINPEIINAVDSILEGQKEEAQQRGMVIIGNCLDDDILTAAKIKEADGVIAVTNDDSTNLMLSQFVKEKYEILRTIVRVDEPLLAETYSKELSEETVCAPKLATQKIMEIIENKWAGT
jgi:trk system potassium uptake protein TrkA